MADRSRIRGKSLPIVDPIDILPVNHRHSLFAERLGRLRRLTAGLVITLELDMELRAAEAQLRDLEAIMRRERYYRNHLPTDLRRIELELNVKLGIFDNNKILSRLTLADPCKSDNIRPQDITNQVEILNRISREFTINRGIPRFQFVETSLRSGRIMHHPVIYKAIVSGSKDVGHELIAGTISAINQLQNDSKRRSTACPMFSGHYTVARFVGVTWDFTEYNGIVVAMDGVNIQEFCCQTHSGAVWATCIRAFESFQLEPKLSVVDYITIAQDGRVTILPMSHGNLQAQQGIRVDFGEIQHRYQSDPAVRLLTKIYEENRSLLAPKHLSRFINSLARLRPAFTKLDIMHIAGSCQLFPFSEFHYFGRDLSPMPSFQPQIGEFGLTSYRDDKLVGWETLAVSQHIKPMDPNNRPTFSGLLTWYDSRTPDGERWFTYVVRDPSLYEDRGMLDTDLWICEKQPTKPLWFRWNDILLEAQDLSKRHNIDINEISFCHRINTVTELTRLKHGDWNELPTRLYYHWSPHSLNSYKAQGFMSTRVTPDLTENEDRYMTQCWSMRFRLSFGMYRMSNDWSRRYERELRQS